MKRRAKFRRSAGNPTLFHVLGRAFRAPSKAALSADMAAIDRGEGRTTVCLFRGHYGNYPRRFRRKVLDLGPEHLVIRHFWSSPSWSRFGIKRDDIISAHARPRELRTDFNVPGSPFDYANFDITTCETAEGTFELAVPRPDVPLVLHYINSRSATSTNRGD
jgi:hypothetical protein